MKQTIVSIILIFSIFFLSSCSSKYSTTKRSAYSNGANYEDTKGETMDKEIIGYIAMVVIYLGMFYYAYQSDKIEAENGTNDKSFAPNSPRSGIRLSF